MFVSSLLCINNEIGVTNKTYLHNRNWSFEIFMQTCKSVLISPFNIDLKLSKSTSIKHCKFMVITQNNVFMFQKITLSK
jgi:hypothetical protein